MSKQGSRTRWVYWVVAALAVALWAVAYVAATRPVQWENKEYGFVFRLPDGWKGYSIVSDEWEGYAQDAGVVERGPLLSIRHPQHTDEVPRQDIPIMVFTKAQWESLTDDNYHIGAAPMGPTELGCNRDYVFALPARYNYSFLEGWEEVAHILEGEPLLPISGGPGEGM